jgi:hypothetical protein
VKLLDWVLLGIIGLAVYGAIDPDAAGDVLRVMRDCVVASLP